MDASLTLVKNGQAIWFYEWNHTSKAGTLEDATKTLISCDGDACREIKPKKEEERFFDSLMGDDEEGVQGRTTVVSSGADPKNEKAYRHNVLMKEIIKDMIAKLN